jgi:cytosine/adenosine deaminase-related metal-dependent hydrolase
VSVIGDAIRYSNGPVRLRARWVVPVDMPPIENGEIVIEDGLIVQVGKASGTPGAHDLGCAAILPGLVNVHAHLEYTVMRGLLEDMAFFPWIRTLTALKSYLTYEDWVASATYGTAEMLASGITTVGDAADAGASLAALIASGQRGVVYREVFGIEREPSIETILTLLRKKITDMRAQSARAGADVRIRLGISPHAPYTVQPDLFRALAGFAAAEDLPQTVHIAETPAETQLIADGTGPFAEMFQRRRIRWSPTGGSPVAHVDKAGALLPGTLAVHTVHLQDGDVSLLKERGAAIAHCPKSNGKLGAGFAAVRSLLDAGLSVGLGTDSVASNNATDMFEEMRFAVFNARAQATDTRALSAREALRMATLGGAEALGLAKEIGSLTRGKKADLCVVRLDGLHTTPTAEDNPVPALVYSSRASDVALTMVEGRVLYESGRPVLLDVARLRQSVVEARKRLSQEVAKSVGSAG